MRRQSAFDAAISSAVPKIDRVQLLRLQQGVVDRLREVKYERILGANDGVTVVRGTAAFRDANSLYVSAEGGDPEIVRFDQCVVATGASPSVPEISGLAQVPFWNSGDALASDVIPERLAIIGSSVVAVEFAQAFSRLGSAVTILARRTLLAREDVFLRERLLAIFRDEGIEVREDCTVHRVAAPHGDILLETNAGVLQATHLLVATGRTPNTGPLNLGRIGIATDRQGAIVVDDYLRTNVAGVYAVGDCTTHPNYVYVAAAAGTRAAVNLMGGQQALDLSTVPAVIFTDPQIATVGFSESIARQSGIAIESRTLGLEHLPRAIVNGDTRGAIRLVADATSGVLLGAQAIAADAGEIIQTAALAIRTRMTVHELGDNLFPYLTMAEGLKLTAQAFRTDVSTLSCCAG
jgi:mercuric reductase